jgi:hypothetical protein
MSRPRTFVLYKGDEEINLPTKKAVCYGCNGEGTHVNRAIDGNGITSSEMDELGDDFREDYMSGAYDVQCDTCGGQRVIDEIDEDRTDATILEAYYKQEEASAREEASEAWLRRAECGW